ncbi:MAG: amino acid ABC transporter permease [Chloroflexota bacterium]
MLPITDGLSRLPYWLLISILLAVFLLWGIVNNQDYRIIFGAVRRGIWTTIYVSIIAYLLATILGLLLSLLRIYQNRLSQEISSFYVEIIRGIPMLVLLYYITFVGAPALVNGLNWLGTPLINAGFINPIDVRQVDLTARAVLALTIGYSAFISEIFRAGIMSIEKEQTEAAQIAGASYGQIMRYIILPQAVRNILPALGNEFIAILKDSSLVSVLGVQDITQLGKVYSASTFKFFEAYNIVAFLYLVMTIGLALAIRYVEKRLALN